MKLRTLAVSAAAATAATVALVPAANAQAVNLDMVLGMNEAAVGFVNNLPCGAFSPTLEGSGLLNGADTRGELVANLRSYIGEDAGTQAAATPTINAIGDKAVECELVQPDPFDPAAMSSALMNGDFTQVIDTLPALSSRFNIDVPFPGLG